MPRLDLPKYFLRSLKAIAAKRPRAVIDHILKHGLVTTEELRSRYGYNHAPRAARDVREQGIPLVTVCRTKLPEKRSNKAVEPLISCCSAVPATGRSPGHVSTAPTGGMPSLPLSARPAIGPTPVPIAMWRCGKNEGLTSCGPGQKLTSTGG
jgi:hypothetical protein